MSDPRAVARHQVPRASPYDYQEWLRTIRWRYHLVLNQTACRDLTDDDLRIWLRRLVYRANKRWLNRYFARMPIDQTIHFVGVFHNQRHDGTRHLHALIAAPAHVSSLLHLWLKTQVHQWNLRPDANTASWTAEVPVQISPISNETYSCNAATYVSRGFTLEDWDERVFFTQPRKKKPKKHLVQKRKTGKRLLGWRPSSPK